MAPCWGKFRQECFVCKTEFLKAPSDGVGDNGTMLRSKKGDFEAPTILYLANGMQSAACV